MPASKGKKSKKVIKIKFVSTGKTKDGKLTGYYYTSTKNTTPKIVKKTTKANTSNKLSKRKYDPRAYNPETDKCGMHVLFEEGKIK